MLLFFLLHSRECDWEYCCVALSSDFLELEPIELSLSRLLMCLQVHYLTLHGNYAQFSELSHNSNVYSSSTLIDHHWLCKCAAMITIISRCIFIFSLLTISPSWHAHKQFVLPTFNSNGQSISWHVISRCDQSISNCKIREDPIELTPIVAFLKFQLSIGNSNECHQQHCTDEFIHFFLPPSDSTAKNDIENLSNFFHFELNTNTWKSLHRQEWRKWTTVHVSS